MIVEKNNQKYELLKCVNFKNETQFLLLTEIANEDRKIILLGEKTVQGVSSLRTVEELTNEFTLLDLAELEEDFLMWMEEYW